jgi:tetratricopeptide (TPR) repeat protein
MRRLLTALAISVAVAQTVAADPAPADRHDNQDKGAAAKQAPATNAPQTRTRPGAVTFWYYPYYGYGYPYTYSYGPGGYLLYGPGYYPYYPAPNWAWSLPPLYAPAQSLFGPDAAKRFMAPDWGPGIGGQANRGREGPANQRGTNAEAVALGGRFLHLGDEYFRAGRYALAYDRYRNAAQAAPRLADAYFRQGLALAALGRDEAAVREIKRGLELNPNWARSRFRLADLYGDNSKAKTAHLDAMAKAADAKGESSDLLFLIGVYLHFDGQAERAKPFFQRAAQLAGGNAAHLEAFFGPPQPGRP